MKLICWLFGHKKLLLESLKFNDIVEVKDILNCHIVSINVCERCGMVYSNLYSDKKYIGLKK